MPGQPITRAKRAARPHRSYKPYTRRDTREVYEARAEQGDTRAKHRLNTWYTCQALLFSISGTWPLPARLRNHWQTTGSVPQLPPKWMLEEPEELAKANAHLAQRGWVLLVCAEPRELRLCRTI